MARPPADPSQTAREAAAAAAVELVEPGMTLGLGSGRALWKVVELIAARWPERAPVRALVASTRTEELAHRAGIELVDPDEGIRPDLAIDGADEVDPDLGLLKGGGGALLREKLVVRASSRFVVVAEAAKRVDRLGATRGVPVEVVRFGWTETRRRLLELLPGADLRETDSRAPYVTDEGHHILDCPLPRDGDLAALGAAIKAETGVVEHGLFIGMAERALLGRPDGAVDELRPV